MRSLIGDQAQATRLALEVLQIGANKVALETLCKEKDTEYEKAMIEFHDGKKGHSCVKDLSYQELSQPMSPTSSSKRSQKLQLPRAKPSSDQRLRSSKRAMLRCKP